MSPLLACRMTAARPIELVPVLDRGAFASSRQLYGPIIRFSISARLNACASLTMAIYRSTQFRLKILSTRLLLDWLLFSKPALCPCASAAITRFFCPFCARFTLFMVCIAGPIANLVMVALWCVALGVIVRVHGNATLIRWIALMSQAGIKANTMLALFHLVPIPPFDCGRVIAGLLPPTVAARFERIEPVGFLIVIGLAALHLFDWLLTPANRLVGHIVGLLLGTAA